MENCGEKIDGSMDESPTALAFFNDPGYSDQEQNS